MIRSCASSASTSAARTPPGAVSILEAVGGSAAAGLASARAAAAKPIKRKRFVLNMRWI
jgi:hypothetical protein